MRRSGLIVLILVAVLAAGGIGYALGDDGRDPTYGLEKSSMAQMMTNGSLQERMQEHTQMVRALRSDMSPEMRAQLDSDEMWMMMESGELAEMMDAMGHMMSQMFGMEETGSSSHGHGKSE
jgi:uncharacterized protein (DUF2342 family)